VAAVATARKNLCVRHRWAILVGVRSPGSCRVRDRRTQYRSRRPRSGLVQPFARRAGRSVTVAGGGDESDNRSVHREPASLVHTSCRVIHRQIVGRDQRDELRVCNLTEMSRVCSATRWLSACAPPGRGDQTALQP